MEVLITVVFGETNVGGKVRVVEWLKLPFRCLVFKQIVDVPDSSQYTIVCIEIKPCYKDPLCSRLGIFRNPVEIKDISCNAVF